MLDDVVDYRRGVLDLGTLVSHFAGSDGGVTADLAPRRSVLAFRQPRGARFGHYAFVVHRLQVAQPEWPLAAQHRRTSPEEQPDAPVPPVPPT